MTMSSSTRRVVAVLLVLAGAGAFAAAGAAWMVSGCCGSPEPSEDGYLVLGALAALVLWGGAYWMFTSPRR
jgi:hypothetical protein